MIKKIINYFDIEKRSGEFVMLCYYGAICLLQNIIFAIEGTFDDNKTQVIVNFVIGILFLVYLFKEVELIKEGKSKLLEKSKGWGKIYPIIMVTLFILSGVYAITKIASGEVDKITTVFIDLVSFVVSMLLIIGTIINRFIKSENQEVKEIENNL